MHVHVDSADGQVKVWLEPKIELAENHGIPHREIGKILEAVERRHDELEQRWRQHHRR